MSEGKIVLRRLKETLDVIKGKTIIGQIDFQIRNMVEDCIDVIETQQVEIERKDKEINQLKDELGYTRKII